MTARRSLAPSSPLSRWCFHQGMLVANALWVHFQTKQKQKSLSGSVPSSVSVCLCVYLWSFLLLPGHIPAFVIPRMNSILQIHSVLSALYSHWFTRQNMKICDVESFYHYASPIWAPPLKVKLFKKWPFQKLTQFHKKKNVIISIWKLTDWWSGTTLF